jgi:cardiolipin synthase A/B
MISWITSLWVLLGPALSLLLSVLASLHLLLYKRNIRARIGWLGLVWLVPLLGVFLYSLFGINRIRRKANLLRARTERVHLPISVPPKHSQQALQSLEQSRGQLVGMVRMLDKVGTRPLVPGNTIRPLLNGEQSYPAMLEAIEQAKISILFVTYIFDNDAVGQQFAEALSQAHARGVEVRVMVDAAGLRYSRPTIERTLKEKGVPFAKFLPVSLPLRAPYINLRNHRKIMVVDGTIGFTGGMNIRQGHMLSSSSTALVQDIHFTLQGPVVAHLAEVFAEDWAFSTSEKLSGEQWFPEQKLRGTSLARGIADGPDEDIDQILWTFHGAIASATSSIRIVSPYFLPDSSLIFALNVAALRGIQVDIVIPEFSNILIVQWAMRAHLNQLLGNGIRIWMTPPPFDHAKLMVVDNMWSLFGSANWDPRSLRLNFEFNVECYEQELAEQLNILIETRIQQARMLTKEELHNDPWWIRIRDSAAQMFVPYL